MESTTRQVQVQVQSMQIEPKDYERILHDMSGEGRRPMRPTHDKGSVPKHIPEYLLLSSIATKIVSIENELKELRETTKNIQGEMRRNCNLEFVNCNLEQKGRENLYSRCHKSLRPIRKL